MKLFIILTVLVAGLSAHARSVLETSPEIFEVGSVLNWTPPANAVETRPSRGIASEVASPSCPEQDPNCGPIITGAASESGTLAGGSRDGVNPNIVTREITTNRDVTGKGPVRNNGRGNNGADDGVSVKRGN